MPAGRRHPTPTTTRATPAPPPPPSAWRSTPRRCASTRCRAAAPPLPLPPGQRKRRETAPRPLPEGCCVCLGDFHAAAEVRRARGCRHVFHRACLDRWAAHGHRTCPLCRTPLLPPLLLPLPLPLPPS
ncbi:unnamed protein product [Miscanthus lutarioriparius]|uniref:RING-type domain-containing protein n=1 Tax=Miscanthus lutarioriparius TaxID=422564 RepID=A0A811S8Y2_9POAL|nr:unnamed protein product [Miscanthus lutarioriparius]